MGVVNGRCAWSCECRATRGVQADLVEVAHVARRDGVASSPRWSHRRDELDVDDLAEGALFQVVPAAAAVVFRSGSE